MQQLPIFNGLSINHLRFEEKIQGEGWTGEH
jgi:hypothetical protein